jgi:hypothetical protein
MKSRRRAAASGYGVTAAISLLLGSVYLTRGSFMPYHGDALGLPWRELDPALQTLLLALMDVAGAGWIAVGVAVLALLVGPFRRGEQWSRLLIPLLLLTFYVPTLMATLEVAGKTAATPPWWGNALACTATLVSLAFDGPWREHSRGSPTAGRGPP